MRAERAALAAVDHTGAVNGLPSCIHTVIERGHSVSAGSIRPFQLSSFAIASAVWSPLGMIQTAIRKPRAPALSWNAS